MPVDQIDDDIVRANWVAKRLGVPKRTVYHLLRSGLLPGKRLGNVWLIRRDVIERIIAEAGMTPAQQAAPAEDAI